MSNHGVRPPVKDHEPSSLLSFSVYGPYRFGLCLGGQSPSFFISPVRPENPRSNRVFVHPVFLSPPGQISEVFLGTGHKPRNPSYSVDLTRSRVRIEPGSVAPLFVGLV